MYTSDLSTLSQAVSTKGIIFDSSYLKDGALSGVKNNFVSDTFVSNGKTYNIVYLPYRNMNTIGYSAGTFSYNYINTSDGTNSYIIYLQWYESDLIALINQLNSNRKARKTTLSTVVTQFTNFAQTYKDNLDFASAAAGGVSSLKTQATTQQADIDATNKSIAAAQTSQTTANANVNTESGKLSALNAATASLAAARDALNTQILQTNDNIGQLTNLVSSKNASKSSFDSTSDQNLADFQTAIASLVAEDASLTTITQLALTNLQALKDPSAQLALILPN